MSEGHIADGRPPDEYGRSDPTDAAGLGAAATGPGAVLVATRPPVAPPAPPEPVVTRRTPTIPWRTLLRTLLVTAACGAALAGPVDRIEPAFTAQKPTAYLLTALFAVLLTVLVRGRSRWDEPDIHDRQIDYLVGLPLLGAALFVLTALPGRYGAGFWTSHADLLGAPLLLAGAVTLAFGTRTLWRLRAPLTLLTFVLVPYPEHLVAAICRGLGRPLFAVASAAAGPLPAWSTPASSAQETLVLDTNSGGTGISFAGALTGVAGPLAVLVAVVLFTATASRWSDAVRRAGGLLGVGLLLLVFRLYLGLIGGSGGPDGARAVLGPVGDGLTLLAMLAAFGTLTWRAERRLPSPCWATTRRRPVERARIALVLVLLTALTMGWLGLPAAAQARLSDQVTGATEGWTGR